MRLSGRYLVVSHHIKGVGYLSGGKLKAEDTMTMPLCVRCHSIMHENPELWGDQWQYTAQTLAKFVKENINWTTFH